MSIKVVPIKYHVIDNKSMGSAVEKNNEIEGLEYS